MIELSKLDRIWTHDLEVCDQPHWLHVAQAHHMLLFTSMKCEGASAVNIKLSTQSPNANLLIVIINNMMT